MNPNAKRFFLTAFIAVTAGLFSAAFGPAFAQANAPEARRGLPHDWSHKHLLYTNADTRDEAARKGTLAFDRWKEKNKDPRFAAQVARKTRFSKAREGNPFSPEELQWARRFDRHPPSAGSTIQRDWSVGLNAGTDAAQGYGKPGMFPAKFNFDINAVPDCTNDFVVFPTTGKGATASGSGSFTGAAATGQTVTITNPSNGQSIVLTATGATGNNTGTNFRSGTSASASATNLAAAIVRNGATVGVTESGAARPTVTVTSLNPGVGQNSITLADTVTNFSWGTSTLAGGADPPMTRPTIVAFNNLYKTTCPATMPGTYWSFNTGAAFTETSPVLSINGDQVAFVQRGGANGQASLVLLKWSGGSGTVASPTVLTSQLSGAAYRSCTPLPCMLVIPFSNSAANTNSSPYVDYVNDILYVGDDRGKLHKFTGVFIGTPAEVTTAPWPVTVSNGTTLGGLILSSPVHDSNGSGLIFVGNNSSVTAGGGLHSVTTDGNTVVHGAAIAAVGATVNGVRDAPIVDSAQGRVYAFVGADVAAADGTNCSARPCMAVYQFTTGLTGGTSRQVGRGTTTGVLYDGAFDNNYYIPSTTGYLYVCGGHPSTASRVRLWQIPITTATNAMGTQVSSGSLTSANAGNSCSPVTEVLNGSIDYIYVSVNAWGTVTPTNGTCAGSATVGCVYVYDITASTFGTAVAGIAATGGGSGIVVDNISATAGASQIYYSTITSPGNAIQASQALLN